MSTRKLRWSQTLGFSLCAVFLSACQTHPLSASAPSESDFREEMRGPASFERNPDMELNFQKMMEAENFQDIFVLKIDQIEFSYYLGIAATADFDRLLDEESRKPKPNPDFQKLAFQKGILARLQASESYGQVAHEQLKYNFLRMVEAFHSSTVSESKKAKIQETFKYISKYLREVPLSTRLALNKWAEDMFTVLPQSRVLKPAYEHLLVGRPELLSQLANEPRVLAHQEKLKARCLSKKDQSFLSLIETFKSYQKEQFEETDRQPQAERPSSVWRYRGAEQSWILSLQGAPHPQYTAEIERLLKESQVTASFFVLGSRVPESLGVVESLKAQGFPVQSAGQTQTELPKLFNDEIEVQLQKSRAEISNITAKPVTLMKAPYSAESPRVREIALNQRVNLVRDDIQGFDNLDRNTDHQVQRILQQMRLRKSGVISLRMDQANSAELLQKLLAGVKQLPGDHRFVSMEGI